MDMHNMRSPVPPPVSLRFRRILRQKRTTGAGSPTSLASLPRLFHNLPAVACDLAPDGTILYVYEALTPILGYTTAELVGENWWQIFYSGENSLQLGPLRDRIRQQDVSHYETVLTARDGTPVDIDWFSTNQYGPAGDLRRITGLGIDVTQRKKAELAQAEERKLSYTILENTPDGIYFKDSQGRFLLVNPAQARILGIEDPSQAVGKSDFDFFSEPFALRTHADEQEILRSGQPLIDKEEKTSWADGREAWFSSTKVPMQIGTRRTAGIFGISRDITGRKQAEAALLQAKQESERALAQFEAAVENMGEGLAIFDPQGVIRYLNPAMLALTGLPATPMEHYSQYSQRVEVWDGQGNRLSDEDFPPARALRGETVRDMEMTVSRRDTGRRYTALYNANLVCDRNGQPLLTMMTVRDITERKGVEETVRESELRYRSIFDGSPIALLEEDFSATRRYLEGLRAAGVQDFAAYFAEHPDALDEAISGYQFIDANPATVQLSGFPSRTAYLENIRSGLRAVPSKMIPQLLAIAEGKHAYQELQTGWNFYGKEMDLELRWVAVPGHEQDLSRVIVSLIDLTDLKQAERALRESEERYRTLFEESPISLWEEDISQLHEHLKLLRAASGDDLSGYFAGHPEELTRCISMVWVLDVNRATVELYQATAKAELLGSFPQIAVDNLADVYIQSIRAVANGKHEFSVETKNRTLTGEMLDLIVRWSIAHGYENSFARALVSVTDVTGLKRVQEDLHRRNAELTTLNAISNLLAETLDPRDVLDEILDRMIDMTYVDGGWVQLLEADSRNLRLETQRGFTEQMVREMSAIPVGKFVTGQVVESGEPAIFEDIASNGWPGTPSAAQAGMRSFFAVAIKSRDRVLGVLGVFSRSPTQLEPQRLQVLTACGYQLGMAIERARLAQTAAQITILEELNRLRAELIANVSHELRTPLGLIKIASTALLSQQIHLDLQTTQELLSGINDETDRLETLVENLLDLSRLENHRLTLNRQTVSLGELLHRSVNSMRTGLAAGQTLELDFPDTDRLLWLDPDRIDQVIRNLISNAIKYSPHGGPIRVDAGLQAGELVVSVRDPGIGIPPDEVGHIFDRFFRGKVGTERKVTGIGLGLPVSKAILDAHGGRIWVESIPGSGSLFSFSVPISPPVSAAELDGTASEAFPTHTIGGN
jgi:PAS domain S-box-containing protein